MTPAEPEGQVALIATVWCVVVAWCALFWVTLAWLVDLVR